MNMIQLICIWGTCKSDCSATAPAIFVEKKLKMLEPLLSIDEIKRPVEETTKILREVGLAGAC